MTAFTAKTTAEEVATALREQIQGKNVLITGASTGSLGFETARVISKYANLVILAGRTKSKLEVSIEAIKKENPNANFRTLTLDLSSWASARSAAAEVNAYSEPIHVLINNAAVFISGEFETTEGIEAQFYGDHLTHFVFTNNILPRLRAAATPDYAPRIVNISSLAHSWSDVRFDDYNFKDGAEYERMIAYAQAKAANVLFTLELAKRLAPENILSFSVHPGSIWTNMLNDFGKEDAIKLGFLEADGVTRSTKFEWKTLSDGAATHVVAAFDPSIEAESGAYLVDAAVHNEQRSAHTSDPANAEKLWKLSEKLVGETF